MKIRKVSAFVLTHHVGAFQAEVPCPVCGNSFLLRLTIGIRYPEGSDTGKVVLMPSDEIPDHPCSMAKLKRHLAQLDAKTKPRAVHEYLADPK